MKTNPEFERWLVKQTYTMAIDGRMKGLMQQAYEATKPKDIYIYDVT